MGGNSTGLHRSGSLRGGVPRPMRTRLQALQRIGYKYIAFGGFVPLKTNDILACLKAASAVRNECTEFHLLGITRCENVGHSAVLASSALTVHRHYAKRLRTTRTITTRRMAPTRRFAFPKLMLTPTMRKITAGEVKQEIARDLEQRCLRVLDEIRSGPSLD